MTSALRVALGVFAGALLLAALFLTTCGVIGPAIYAGFFGALLFVGLVFERWRYKPLTDTRLGPEWVATDERFVDPETGKLVTVFYHPATGERRYVAP
jgi:hypothetical protein